MIQGGLKKLLLSQSSITTLLDYDPAAKEHAIYIGKREQKARTSTGDPIRKCIVITRLVGGNTNPSLDGGSNLLIFVDVDFDCYGPTEYDAARLANKVRTFIDDYSGAAGDETIGAVVLDEPEAYDYIPPDDGSDNGDHVYTVTGEIQYTPATT